MVIKFLNECDFINYKKPSMFIGMPYCSWKCEKEVGCSGMCQNSRLADEPVIDFPINQILERYQANPITKAFVFGGLEPFDSWEELARFIAYIRLYTSDDIVIYTGYKEEEIQKELSLLSLCKNIIVKFGRYVPGGRPHKDEILGVELASDNQYAKYIGDKI